MYVCHRPDTTGTEPFQKWLDGIDTIAAKLDVKFSVYMSELNYEGDARSLVAVIC
jgi:hypothetical protein